MALSIEVLILCLQINFLTEMRRIQLIYHDYITTHNIITQCYTKITVNISSHIHDTDPQDEHTLVMSHLPHGHIDLVGYGKHVRRNTAHPTVCPCTCSSILSLE